MALALQFVILRLAADEPDITFMMFFGIPDFAGKKHGDSAMQSGHAAKYHEMWV
jgi:hypothetical protein